MIPQAQTVNSEMMVWWFHLRHSDMVEWTHSFIKLLFSIVSPQQCNMNVLYVWHVYATILLDLQIMHGSKICIITSMMRSDTGVQLLTTMTTVAFNIHHTKFPISVYKVHVYQKTSLFRNMDNGMGYCGGTPYAGALRQGISAMIPLLTSCHKRVWELWSLYWSG